MCKCDPERTYPWDGYSPAEGVSGQTIPREQAEQPFRQFALPVVSTALRILEM